MLLGCTGNPTQEIAATQYIVIGMKEIKKNNKAASKTSIHKLYIHKE